MQPAPLLPASGDLPGPPLPPAPHPQASEIRTQGQLNKASDESLCRVLGAMTPLQNAIIFFRNRNTVPNPASSDSLVRPLGDNDSAPGSGAKRLLPDFISKILGQVVTPGRFELPTRSLGNCCSIHLSYGATFKISELETPLFTTGHFRSQCYNSASQTAQRSEGRHELKQAKPRYQQGSIQKVQRKHGFVWRIRFSGWCDGRRHQNSITLSAVRFPTEADVRRELEVEVHKQNRDSERAKVGALFSAITGLYRDEHLKSLEHSTRQTNCYQLKNYIEPKFQSMPIRDVTALAVSNWLAELTLAPSTKVVDQVGSEPVFRTRSPARVHSSS
jgi:integrase-like protein